MRSRHGGPAVADVVHLLAELVDNPLRCSPPQSAVEVRGQRHHSGFTLTVADEGMGMQPDEIDRANQRWPAPRSSRSPRRSTWATT